LISAAGGGYSHVARASLLIVAILFDFMALGAFLIIMASADPVILVISIGSMAAIFAFEKVYLSSRPDSGNGHSTHQN